MPDSDTKPQDQDPKARASANPQKLKARAPLDAHGEPSGGDNVDDAQSKSRGDHMADNGRSRVAGSGNTLGSGDTGAPRDKD